MKKSKSINELLKMKRIGKPYWGLFLRPKEKVVLVSAPKKGKTFLGIQLAASLACGINFLNFKTIQTRVMYLNLEMDEEMMGARIADIASNISAPYEVLNQNLIIKSDWNLRLDSKSYQDDLIKEVQEKSIKIIFVDPLQKALKGSDSSDRDLRRLINRVDRIIQNTGVAFFIIHHTPKKIRANDPAYVGRGHSILGGWADTILHLDGRKLKVTTRASSIDDLKVFFKYPIWRAGDWQSEVERVQLEVKNILEQSPRGKKSRLKLQRRIKSSEWSFKEALKRMKEQGVLKIKRLKGNRYNQKIIVLIK